MPLPQTKITISNVDRATGNIHIEKIRAVVDGPIRRTIGSSGDPVTLTVLAAEWPATYDKQGEFHININEGELNNAALTLKGYRLKMMLPVSMGTDLGDTVSDPTPREYRLLLETQLSAMREGYGGLLTEGTLNELDQEGLVDINHLDYKTNRELVDLCLDAIGLDHEAATVDLDLGVDSSQVFAPGPLDWGNARPLNELDAILTRLGWTVVQLNDGTIATRRLLRAGQPINIPANIAAVAEPYELGVMPGMRGAKMIVTSGATRSTIVTSRSFSSANPLEWTIFDPASNSWGPQPITALADYQGGLKAADLTPDASKQIGQLYKAVRLSGDDLLKASTFVNIPTAVDFGDYADFAGAPGVIEASCCIKVAGDQLENVPVLDGTRVRIDGLRAISGHGVFVLPADAEYVRLDGLNTGRRGDTRELVSDELIVTFAHEANTGTFVDDYFVVGFEWTEDLGAVSINTMLSDDVLLALDDPDVVKVGAPMLRRIMTWNDADAEAVLVSLNSDDLTVIAKQIATARMADSLVESGAIVLKGIIDINPGDIEGAVTSVSWNPVLHATIITVNQHEVPKAFYDKLQRASGNSVASGIGFMRLGRSSAALGDVRNTLISNDALPIDGAATPEGNAPIRGRVKSISGVRGAEDSGVRVRRELPTIAEQTEIYARITGSTSIGPNRWEYDWEEARIADGVPVTAGAVRSSVSHGKALNTVESNNTGAGIQGNGVNVDTLLDGFLIQPVSDKPVPLLRGPFNTSSGPIWLFESENAVDGVCPPS